MADHEITAHTSRSVELLNRIKNDPYNEVTAHKLPDGGVMIMLSHRISLDEAVLIRIPAEADIRFLNWDKDREANERTNTGGGWTDGP